MPPYRTVKNLAEWKDVLSEDILAGKPRTVFVAFFAKWSSPCRRMEPLFDTLAEQNSEKMLFVKMDYDEAEDVAAKYNVNAVPAYLIFRRTFTLLQMAEGGNSNTAKDLVTTYSR